jgi:tetrahydromethanopterin S-methyltransferase subunit B
MDLGKIDAEMKKGIDARTKEFREKLTKLTYEKIKAKLKPSTHPLKGYPHNESIDEARKMPKNPAIDNDPKVKAARKDHAAGIWDGNVDKEGEAIVFVKGKPYTVTNKYESIEESVGKAVNGLNDLGNKMKGRDQKDIRRIEKLYRSGNNKVFQGAIRALDTDLRDQVKDIFDALGMVKQGVIESVDLTEGKMKEFHDMVKKGMTAEQISKKIGIDVKAIKDFMKDMDESTTDKKMLSVSDMNEKVMTLKQIAQKYKGDIAKAQKSGNSNSLKKAEKELLGWAAQHNEISGKDSTEADDWLSNVVADKDQFAALLKFAKD